jgi:hypothetical protein
MGLFVQGMSAMACVVIAIFFLRFWRSTGDRLFLIFAIAFGLMCVTRAIAAEIGAAHLHSGYVYTIRFVGYVLIIAAIFDKNRPRPSASD